MGRAVSPPKGAADGDPLLTPEEVAPVKKPAKANAAPLPSDRGGEAGSQGASLKRKGSAEDWISRTGSVGSDFGRASSAAQKYQKIGRVGEGAYGSVYKAEFVETKEIVAVKATTRSEDPVLGGFPLSLLREISILRRLQHENIVSIHEIAVDKSGNPLIVMEFCESSLLELLNSRSHDLSLSELKYVIRQVLDATRYMHERGILHRDLATKNILFNTSGEIKVCDFGISRIGFAQDEEFGFIAAKDLEDPNMIVSLPYRAIELLLGQQSYGPALDVWAAGAILGEIIMCQGGRRQTFFGGDRECPNKTPQMVVEEIFGLLGKPSETSWPGVTKLPLWRSICGSSGKIDRMKAHRVEAGEEKTLLMHFFKDGGGKGLGSKYNLAKTGCFDLLGSLLTLNPAKRISAADSLKHGFFTEKPAPEWHSWHWAQKSKEIPRGAEMRKQRAAEGDADVILRQLSKEEEHRDKKDAKSVKERAREAMQERLNQKKQKEMAQQQQQQQQVAGLHRTDSLQGKSQAAQGSCLPSGWTKHWSKSKQTYYYHNHRTSETTFERPKA
mmetsp:Transcript_64302/g.153344  ORF Transcript_64302/g.153344 Transcript_64302/m.153344 type:complete len:556 (+) Transcript_64302:69-1736(+)